MSMDLEVWSPRQFVLPSELPRADQWEEIDDEFSFDGGGWQVLVMSEPGDPDSLVTQLLPGATHVAYVTLEPIGAEQAGYMLLEEVVRTLARSSGGVWLDADGLPHRPDEGNF